MTLRNPFGQLPRDTRDTLFLLLLIGWVMLPQVQNLPLWASVMSAAMLIWRGVLAWRARPLPSRWWLLALALAAFAATLWTHRTIFGRDAGVTLIFALLALKTLELRARRDTFVVFFLCFFAMLTNFFFSQSLSTAAAMLLALLGLLTALVNAHMPVGQPPLLEAAKTASWMTLLGAPVMVILFVLFPRIAPLWGVPSDAMSGRSGLSGDMTVGNIASLALDDSVAFRVRFDGAPPRNAELYFRGPVLSSFDGRSWRTRNPAASVRPALAAELRSGGPVLTYEVTQEPSNRPWLFLLEAAAQVPRLAGFQVGMGADLQWFTDRPVTELLRFKAQSQVLFSHGPLRAVPALADYLTLPANSNPRTVAWARELREQPRPGGTAPEQLVQAALQQLRTGGYRYTLEPGLFGQHTADEFWFDRKEGFCEHIASSFVVLMRALDIPARIVTGYQGGELNAVDNYWVVRQSDAHAWAEVWLSGRGWVRVDPTASVAPGRVGSLTRLQAPRSALGAAIGSVSPQVALNLRAMWEAVNNRWNQWVLNYSQSRQLDLLRNLGFESPSWEHLGYLLAAITVLAGLVGAAWTLWERTRHDPWLRLLASAQVRLAKAGLRTGPTEPPRQSAVRLLALRGQSNPAARAVHDWLLQLEALRYAPRDAGATSLAALKRQLATLPWRQIDGQDSK